MAKRCGLCRFSADEEAAFVEHMQSVHQWGEAVLHLRSALAKHRLRLIIASPVLFAFLPSGIGDFGRLLIIFVTGELLLVHALVTAKGPLWARMIGLSLLGLVAFVCGVGTTSSYGFSVPGPQQDAVTEFLSSVQGFLGIVGLLGVPIMLIGALVLLAFEVTKGD